MKNLEDSSNRLRDLRQTYPSRKITLEIHESTITDPRFMLQLRTMLDDWQLAWLMTILVQASPGYWNSSRFPPTT